MNIDAFKATQVGKTYTFNTPASLKVGRALDLSNSSDLVSVTPATGIFGIDFDVMSSLYVSSPMHNTPYYHFESATKVPMAVNIKPTNKYPEGRVIEIPVGSALLCFIMTNLSNNTTEYYATVQILNMKAIPYKPYKHIAHPPATVGGRRYRKRKTVRRGKNKRRATRRR